VSLFNLKDHLEYESVSNSTLSCLHLKQQGKITVNLNGEDVVLDTAAKLHKHLDCLNEQQQAQYVHERMFKLAQNDDMIRIHVEPADVAEWMRYGSTKVDSISILNSLQPFLSTSIMTVLGLGRYFKRPNIFNGEPLPRDIYWNVNYDYSSQSRVVDTAFHSNQLNSVFGLGRQ
jgi:hypothetical protein